MRAFMIRTAAAAIVLVAANMAAAAAAPVTRDLQKSYAPGSVTRLDLTNLAGHVVIARSDGPLLVKAKVVADAATGAEAQSLAHDIGIRERKDGSSLKLAVDYAVGNLQDFYYDPHPGHGHYRTTFRYDNQRVTVRGGGSREGADVHVDITLQVPVGMMVKVSNFVGDVAASDVQGDVSVDVQAGTVDYKNGEGHVELSTGSGSVRVIGHTGEIAVDTGSGNVYLENVKGSKISADTGSGAVLVEHASADLIYADTGSGPVTLHHVLGSLKVDTGSGGLVADDYTAGKSVYIDTGSGSVRLEGDLSAMQSLYVDTGSGSVHLSTSAVPSMRLRVSTSNDVIDVDLPGMHDIHSDRGDFSAIIGTGTGKGLIDTGSGDVSFKAD